MAAWVSVIIRLHVFSFREWTIGHKEIFTFCVNLVMKMGLILTKCLLFALEGISVHYFGKIVVNAECFVQTLTLHQNN